MSRNLAAAGWILALAAALWLGAGVLLFGHPEAMAAGPLGDGSTLERWWNYWYCSQQVGAAKGPLDALRVAFLEGYPAFGNTADFWVLGWPMERTAPWPVWFNLQGPVVVLLNGLAAAWAARQVVGPRPAALAAGLFFGLNPWSLTLLRDGYIREAFMVFPVLLAGTACGLLRQPRLGDAALAGLWLGLSGVFYWFYALFGALLVVLWSLGALAVSRFASSEDPVRPPRPAHLAVLALTALVVAAPFARPFLRMVGPGHEVTWGVGLPTPAQLRELPPGDQAAWHGITSGSLHNLFGHSLLPDWPANLGRRAGQPFWLLALALAAVFLRPWQAWPWAASGGLFYLLSLGPHLRTASGYLPSDAAPLGLPFGFFFARVPFFSRLFHPDRCALFAVLALAVLAALALDALAERKGPSRHLPSLLPALAMAAWGATLLLVPSRPVPVWEIPAFYLRVDGDLVEVPVRHRMDALREGPGIYQVVHGRRVLTWDDPGPAGEDPFFRWLADPRGEAPADASGLRAAGVRYLVLHEAGCYSLDADGAARYEQVRSALVRALGQDPQESFETPPPPVHPRAPRGVQRFRMSVFRLD